MVDNIIPFKKTIETFKGEARCLLCGHEFDGEADYASDFMQCPECGIHKAVFIGPVIEDKKYGTMEWSCQCGNHLFLLKPEFALCPHCGREHYYNEL